MNNKFNVEYKDIKILNRFYYVFINGLQTTEEVLNIFPKDKLNIFIKEVNKNDAILQLKLFQYKDLDDNSKIKLFEEINSLSKKEKEQLKKEFPEMYKKMEEDFNKQDTNKFKMN